MKTALVTTTINIPTVLQLYRACNEDVRFFVAIDKKTPEDAVNFCQHDVPNCQVLFIEDQMKWKCSELIGWNTISRRNIAILEALKWGAEIIVTIDDDNIPMDTAYFDHFEYVLGAPFNGLRITATDTDWFDVGQFLVPKAPHRGMPHWLGHHDEIEPITAAKVGVAAGICLGDPDIAAHTRMTNHPVVHNVSELLRAGIVVAPGTRTVFNSQNTAFLRELAPCFLMHPHFQRHDDIFASLIAQRVMRKRGMHVHFGRPFIYQQRNVHHWLVDLKAELFGMEHIVYFASYLDQLTLTGKTVLEDVRNIWEAIRWIKPDGPWSFLAGTSELGLAWCQDCESVL